MKLYGNKTVAQAQRQLEVLRQAQKQADYYVRKFVSDNFDLNMVDVEDAVFDDGMLRGITVVDAYGLVMVVWYVGRGRIKYQYVCRLGDPVDVDTAVCYDVRDDYLVRS